MSKCLRKIAGLWVLLLFVSADGAFGATQFVDASVVDGFKPSVVNILTGDTVQWNATGGKISISGTGIGSTNSGGNTIDSSLGPKSFSFQFTTAGSFPYTDTINPGLQGHSGTVNVTAAPPTVSISSPTNGSVFAPGASIPFTLNLTNSVTSIQFYVNGSLIAFQTGSNNAVSFSESVEGQYVLTAVVTNSPGVVSTSAPVNITVTQQISISSPTNNLVILTNTPFSFLANVDTNLPAPMGLQFLVNGTAITNRTSQPWGISNLSEAATGSYILTVIATNSVGIVTTSAPVTVFIGEQVGISGPSTNSFFVTSDSILLSPDLSKISLLPQSVGFMINGNAFSNRTATPFSVHFSTNVPGIYQFSVIATNSAGISSTGGPVNVLVAGVAGPATNSTYFPGQTIPLSANLLGSNSVPQGVDFLVNSSRIATTTTSPFTANFTTNAIGAYTFRIALTNGAGIYSMSAPVTFNVIDPAMTTSVASGLFAFGFATVPNVSYQVQTSVDLKTWTSISTNTPSLTNSTFSTPIPTSATNTNAFFRLLYSR